MDYTPYDLLNLRVNGKEIHGRPIEFDSEVADNMTMLNAAGSIVKPTKLSTVCPDCGGGMVVEMPTEIFGLTDYRSIQTMLDNIDWPCPTCKPDAPVPMNPFMNPLEEKRIQQHELDPLLHNPEREIKQETTTVASRLDFVHDEVEIVVKSTTLHGTNSSLILPEEPDISPDWVDPETQKDPSEDSEEEEAQEPPLVPKVEKKPKKIRSKPQRTVELEPADDMTKEEDLEDLVDDE